MYLKLNDSVLIHINIPGGDGVLPELTGDKHHRRLILLSVCHTYKKVIICLCLQVLSPMNKYIYKTEKTEKQSQKLLFFSSYKPIFW